MCLVSQKMITLRNRWNFVSGYAKNGIIHYLITLLRYANKCFRKLYFEDLTSKEAMDLFERKFVKKFNRGELKSMYYRGIPSDILDQTKRTAHKWAFMDRLDESERLKLASTKDTVAISTNRAAKSKLERKKYYKDKRVVEEELVPKSTGREAVIEKRKQVGQKLHGASRDREENQDGLDLSESVTMGGSDNFQAKVRARKDYRDRKDAEKAERIHEIQIQESERMRKFVLDMGLEPGQRVRIAKRE